MKQEMHLEEQLGARPRLLAPLLLPFLPGLAGSLRSRGDGIAAGGASELRLRRAPPPGTAGACRFPARRRAGKGDASRRAGRLMSCEKRAA